MSGEWLERHWRSVLLLIGILAAAGITSAWRLPVGLFPVIDFPRVVVSVDAGERPVDRMVVEVTRPLERALRGVPSVQKIRSTSSRGDAELSLTFGWGTDMVAALLQSESAVNRQVGSLPAGTTFTVRRMDPTVFPMLGLTLTSPNQDLVALRDFATYQLSPVLSAIPGVADVEVLGGRQAEYQVLLDPLQLESRGLTIADVAQALTANNVVSAVGRIEDHYRLYLTLSDTRLKSQEEIGNTILKSDKSGIVRLEDVGQVRLGQQPEWTRVTADGRDAVLVNVKQQRDANTVALAREVRGKLAALPAELKRGTTIGIYYDQSDLIVASASSVGEAIVIGALLAAVILFGFLRNVRVTLVVALILPVVISITVLLLNLLGMSFNVMTLGGIAAAVGLIVDDAVVMVEHIIRRVTEARTSEGGVVKRAAAEMLRPLAGSSLATIIVFAPLSFLSGVAGGFFLALALTMACGLVVSFLVTLLAVPLLAQRVVTADDAERLERVGPMLARMHRGYARRMRRWLERPRWVALLLLACAAVGGIAYSRLGSGFMPHMDEGGFIFDYQSAPGTSLSETDRLLRQVEAIVSSLPEVKSYSRRTGLQLGGGLTEANEGDMFIRLKPPPRRDIEEVMAELRQRVEAEVPGLRVETAQLMEDLIGDLIANPQPIEIKLFGDDPEELGTWSRKVAEAIEKVPGVVEVFDGVKIAGDAVEVRVDRARAALEGLDPEAVGRQVQAQLEGTLTSAIQHGEKMVGVRVWTPDELRQRVSEIGEFRLRAADGHMVPVKRIAEITVVAGQPQIQRENLRPLVAVTARLEHRDLGSAMRDVKTTVVRLKLPGTVQVEYGGLYQEQRASFRDLAVVFVAAVLLIFVLLMFLYERIAVVLSLLLTTFGSVAAVFVGLWITGTELNISSLMGMTMVLGIVTEVAIFYFAELDPSEPHDAEELINAGVMRMRPIVMTASIAVLALMPLALGLGTGSSMQQPLAISIVSGLIFAVPMVLMVMPVLYHWFSGAPKQRS